PAAEGEVALDRPLVFTESARVVRYAWAVHELPAELYATDEPARRDVRLLAYRDETHAVRWLELTPLASGLVERLLSGETLRAAVQEACADHGTEPGPVLADVSRLLSDLAARGVVVGAPAR
ncbi:MAG TPA: DUF2063 domain-containing protein, partial [Polyangiaceae bacterium]|nr:DUF2063 domain-containing protein [Polyangiaceae bacterium]